MTNPRLPAPARSASGFTLIEMAVVLAVLGMVGILIVQWARTADEVRHQTVQRDLLGRSDDALLAYAMVNHRLPCPAADQAGHEDCSANRSTGWLPYATLGLPDGRAGRLRYGVLRRGGGTSADDADLAVLRDRLWPLQVSASGVGSSLPLGNVNGLDFCQGLRTAMRDAPDADYVHTLDAATGRALNVAYALAGPGASEPLASLHQGASTAFASPRDPGNAGYHDEVRAVGLDQLWTHMRCGDNAGAAGYAHPNLAAAARIDTLALEDYKEQLEIALLLAKANLASAIAAGISVGSGLTGDIAADTTDSVAETIETLGAMAAHVALSTTAITMNALAIASAAAFLAVAITTEARAEQIYGHADRPLDLSKSIEPQIIAHAQQDDAMGLYIDPVSP